MSAPNSTIYICSVAFNSSFEHTPFFDTVQAQRETFAGCVQKTYSAYSFLRESWSIKVVATKAETATWNYLFYTNDGTNYFYYFIDRIEYKNESMVELFLTLDVMQTYHFRYTLLPSFVEREHSSTDNIGDNITDEGLEIGEHIVYGDYSPTGMTSLCILALSQYDLRVASVQTRDQIKASGAILSYGKIDGIFSGCGLYACDLSRWSDLMNALDNLDYVAKSDGVISMWMFPKNYVQLMTGHSWNTESDKRLPEVYGFKEGEFSTTRPGDLNGYTPRNKKLLTYPYSFLYLHNNMGTSGVYRYELFDSPSDGIFFNIVGSVLPDGGIKMYPRSYKNAGSGYEEGVTITGFPTCAWNQDAYKLWLAQNQSSRELAMATGITSIIGGAVGLGVSVATGGLTALAGGGAMISGASQIANLLASKADAKVQPHQSKGSLSGSVNVVAGKQTFSLQRKVIQKHYAQRLDEYFDVYGYKTNRVKVPNRCVRKVYTYTKTVGCHIRGSVPSDHAKQIEQIFDKGITFWKNGSHIGEYGQHDNSPL